MASCKFLFETNLDHTDLTDLDDGSSHYCMFRVSNGLATWSCVVLVLLAFERRAVSRVMGFINVETRSGPVAARRADTNMAIAADSAVDAGPFQPPALTATLDTASGPLNGSRGEVVGSTGRIGSLILRSGGGLLAASPRGLRPGSLSPPGTPIFVAVPTSAIANVIRLTPRERRGDIVLISNGLPSRLLGEFDEDELGIGITVTVPHFGVLQTGAEAVTSPISPSTVVHGKHSTVLMRLLVEQCGINVVKARSMEEVEACAARKLLWTSLMWLLCHEDGDPIDVTAVHETKSEKLQDLVQELLPVANSLAEGNIGTVENIMEAYK